MSDSGSCILYAYNHQQNNNRDEKLRRHETIINFNSVSSYPTTESDSGSSTHTDTLTKRSWRKVLYEKQNFADNYLDPDRFLDSFYIGTEQNNQSFYESYMVMLTNCSVIIHQITVVAIFLTAFKYIIYFNLSYGTLLLLNVFCMVAGILLYYMFTRKRGSFVNNGGIDKSMYLNQLSDLETRKLNIFESVRYVFVFGVSIRASSPIFQILTENFSGNTIYAIVIVLVVTHLVFYDYVSFFRIKTMSHSSDEMKDVSSLWSSGRTEGISTTGTLSLNAAMFTAIVLASRLQNVMVVALFCLLAVQFFFLLPDLTAVIVKSASIDYYLALTALMWALASALLLQFKTLTLFAVYQSIVIFLWVFCSLWLVYMQKHYRLRYRGPWEEAKVD